ncbi:unnamed protein product [Lepeophtheirus salmonis]|uniref:(salmon louse) hypothetical protein n=1 Tax=Lepeophtheirus salmonis TaxID=72036 RepID=A0A7R8D1Y1_LEPSM|nr:unnamed protein product [Lepeophtheirus salmonis]CAF2997871.1 unnamed protein product [Lepeophtheirus salmonis]
MKQQPQKSPSQLTTTVYYPPWGYECPRYGERIHGEETSSTRRRIEFEDKTISNHSFESISPKKEIKRSQSQEPKSLNISSPLFSVTSMPLNKRQVIQRVDRLRISSPSAERMDKDVLSRQEDLVTQSISSKKIDSSRKMEVILKCKNHLRSAMRGKK